MKITIYEKLNSVKLYLFIRISQLLQKVKREASGLGVVEVIMILLGILTPYYGGSIKCIT